jgi:hypothetical protein
MHYGSFMGLNCSFLSASRTTMLHTFKFTNSSFPTLYIHVFCVTRTIKQPAISPPVGRCDRDAVVSSVTWKLRVPARWHSSEKRPLSSCSPVSICPRDSTQLSMDGFPSNLILETYKRACLEYPNLVKILKVAFHVKS